MTPEWMRQIFMYNGEGGFVDTYLSFKKRRNTNKLFGFARYNSEEEAMKVMGRLNGVAIRDCKITISLARYERRRDIPHFLRKTDSRKFSEVVTTGRTNAGNQHKSNKQDDVERQRRAKRTEEQAVVIQGEVAQESLEWLRRCVIGQGMISLAIDDIESRLKEKGCAYEWARPMGSNMMLICLSTSEECEVLLQSKKEPWLSLFDEVRKWSTEEAVHTRKVWLEFKGLPLHGWSRKNLTRSGRHGATW